ncbi:hypothetical protein C8N32_105115 [Rhodovulum imhoffii]|uniref:Uncharacterized protein n=1 Tax=Rhodovulum imhoffii TaxID=365340 RepID=A0A2T5BTJ7_9RHOB|nr:hypothetical protein [Rhodovulum imhoffii]MBK5934309.1 hypothetical protein [Rhodovulum imhoffii]PTN02743.1 hypothetical protein C8N32_105115 [Rhodovulum imhoffii]
MWRLFKVFVFLAAAALIALAGYAYLGDLQPDPQEMRQPVTFDAQ